MDQNTKKTISQPKPVYDILQEQIDEGSAQHGRPARSLFLSSLNAGLEIGFSVLIMGALYTFFASEVSAASLHILIAAAYPVGFIIVVIGKSELFTEHTTVAVLPVLQGSKSMVSLGRLWGIVLLGNLLGGYFFSVILATLPVDMEMIKPQAYIELARAMIDYDWYLIIGSATLAGWLMGLLSWLVASSQETISRILVVTLITFIIGIVGLHHSIVGSIEVFTAYLLDGVTLTEYFFFEIYSIVGNIIGGAVFVALLKFGHTQKADQKK